MSVDRVAFAIPSSKPRAAPAFEGAPASPALRQANTPGMVAMVIGEIALAKSFQVGRRVRPDEPGWQSTARSARTPGEGLQALGRIGPTPPSVAGTPADRHFDNAASDTPDNAFKNGRKTGSTPLGHRLRQPGRVRAAGGISSTDRPHNRQQASLLSDAVGSLHMVDIFAWAGNAPCPTPR